MILKQSLGLFVGSLRATRSNASTKRCRFFHTFKSCVRQETSKGTANGAGNGATKSYTQKELLEFINIKRRQESSKRNQTAINYALSFGIGFLTLAYASVPLYRALCSRTGFGGTPITDQRTFTADKLIPVDTNKRIRIAFTSETSAILPWKFTPQQREVYLVPGETALAFYKARNTSSKDITGMATYSVTPGEAAPYFNKIQCFCFEEQKLLAGEEVDMPVFFFIDPDFAKDPSMRNIDDIVLHYTFFKAHYDRNAESLAVENVKDQKEQSYIKGSEVLPENAQIVEKAVN